MLRQVFNAFGLALLELPFPRYCPGCSAPQKSGQGWLCPACWNSLEAPRGGLWRVLGQLRHSTLAVFSYAGLARDLIQQFKFNGRLDIGLTLAERAAPRVRNWLAGAEPVIVPVPLHPVRVRERGFDQNRLLADRLASLLNLPIRTDLIRRARNTRPQSRLSDDERLRNLHQAFIPNSAVVVPAPEMVMLVDDVIHTGATATGCIDALAQAGTEEAVVLALCG